MGEPLGLLVRNDSNEDLMLRAAQAFTSHEQLVVFLQLFNPDAVGILTHQARHEHEACTEAVRNAGVRNPNSWERRAILNHWVCVPKSTHSGWEELPKGTRPSYVRLQVFPV